MSGWKVFIAAAAVLAPLLAVILDLLPTRIPLTEAERAALPGTGRAVAGVLVVAAVIVGAGAWRRRRTLVAAGYAAVVMALPFVTAPLMRAVGDDRSSAALADAVRGKGAVLGVGVYPTSLPFYLQTRVYVATRNAHELTSNFIADYADTYRAVPGSPLLQADAWRSRLATCPESTVFVARAGDREARSTLAALPQLFDDGHYAAYGPCAAGAPPRNSSVSIPHSAFGTGGAGK